MKRFEKKAFSFLMMTALITQINKAQRTKKSFGMERKQKNIRNTARTVLSNFLSEGLYSNAVKIKRSEIKQKFS